MRFSTAIAFMLPLSALCGPLAIRAPPEVDSAIILFRGRVQSAIGNLESLKNFALSVAGGPEIDSITGGAERIGFIIGGAEAAQHSVRQTSAIVEQSFSAENVPHMPQEALRQSVRTMISGRCPMYNFANNLIVPDLATPGSEGLKKLKNGIGAALFAVDYVIDALGGIASLDGMSLESLFEAAGGRIPFAGECFKDL